MVEEKKKLYRSADNYIISGVAGGLGDYLEVDATFIRLIFLILALGGGSGIVLYIILAILVPKEAQREIPVNRGEKVKEMVKEAEEKVGDFAEDMGVKLPERKRNRRAMLGIILMIIGGVALWNQIMPYYIRAEILWPVILIIVGMVFIFK
jgi:phage shock protein C